MISCIMTLFVTLHTSHISNQTMHRRFHTGYAHLPALSARRLVYTQAAYHGMLMTALPGRVLAQVDSAARTS